LQDSPRSVAQMTARYAVQGRGGMTGIANDGLVPGREPPQEASDIDARAILNSIGEAVYDWDILGDRLIWSANAARLLKVRQDAITSGLGFDRLLDPVSPQTRREAILFCEGEDRGGGVAYRLHYAFGNERGPLRWVEDTGRWFAGSDGRPALAHGVVRVLEGVTSEQILSTTAGRIDPLTGVFTRSAFAKVLDDEIARIAPRSQHAIFMMASINDLAQINRDYGFQTSDQVIAGVTARCKGVVRARDRLVRYAGNKIGLLLSPFELNEAENAATRVLHAIQSTPIHTESGPIAVGVTLGGVVIPRDARTSQDVLQRAEEALQDARDRRAQTCVFYMADAARDEERRRNRMATEDVIAAINQRRLAIALEPVLDAKTREAAFHECLVRVLNPQGEVLGAGQIIPTAERFGLIRFVDHRVLELAASQLARSATARLSINVSMRTAGDADWLDALSALCRATPGLGPRLTVEITETAAVEDVEATKRFVERLKAEGCRIAIDDFGSGHTSFRNMRALPIDLLKIDGVFVQNLMRSADDRFFVRTLVDLAKHLGVQTVAEWVQDAESAALLQEWGVDFLQGEYCGLARLPAEEVAAAA
jgi:diguanylate cyclase (GGDEF)-like protein